MNLEKLDALEKPQALKILIAIKDIPVLTREEIYSMMIGSKPTKVARINELIEAGLIKETKQGLHNRKILSITKKGREAAGVITELNNILVDYKNDSNNH